jgi:hypothetical protein
VAGSYAGARLSSSVRPDLLLSLFAGLMLVAAAAMLRRRRGAAGQHVPAAQSPPAPRQAVAPGDLAASALRGGAITATLAKPAAAVLAPGRPVAWPRPRGSAVRRGLKIIAAATGVGLLTGFFGVGGGFVIVPALVLALGFDMPAAVGTSLLVIAINSATALAARLGSLAGLDWALLGVFTAAALAGALAGNRVASRIDPSRLTTAFTVLLIAVAAYSLVRSLPGLV